ncbi:unnamed protein product [Musa acuminata var. zebrina]
MVTIRRVPTVLSTCQEDSGQPGGCGRNCLGNCCLPATQVRKFLPPVSTNHRPISFSRPFCRGRYYRSCWLFIWQQKQQGPYFKLGYNSLVERSPMERVPIC